METMKKVRLFSWLILFVMTAIVCLTSCGSWRPSSQNFKDDQRNNRLENQVANANDRDDAETERKQAVVQSQINGLKTLAQDAKAATDGKYLGIISTPYVRKNNIIRYDVMIGMKRINRWKLPGGTVLKDYLPVGNYQVIGYKLERDTWKLKTVWDLEVTNTANSDGYHFEISGFE